MLFYFTGRTKIPHSNFHYTDMAFFGDDSNKKNVTVSAPAFSFVVGPNERKSSNQSNSVNNDPIIIFLTMVSAKDVLE